MPTTIPTDALTSRAKVKSYLGITGTDNDALIDELITYVTQFIKSYCGGRKFLAADYVETYDSYRTRRVVFLKQRPCNSITTVEYCSGTPSAVVWVTYNADSYLKYLEEGYIKFYAQLPQISQGFRVSYNAGYKIDFSQEFDPLFHTLPEDITLVATELVVKILNTRKAVGISNESTEGQSVTYSRVIGELEGRHVQILGSYKYLKVAR
jgi:hypothetical protein